MLKQVATFGFTTDENSMLRFLLKSNSNFIFRGDIPELSDLVQVDSLLIYIKSRSAKVYHDIKTIRTEFPKLSVIVLTKYADLNTIEAVLGAGANGYILKSPDYLFQLLSGLYKVSSGGGALSPKAARILVKSFRVNKNMSQDSKSPKNGVIQYSQK